jgi:hypothetical protein
VLRSAFSISKGTFVGSMTGGAVDDVGRPYAGSTVIVLFVAAFLGANGAGHV